MKMYKYSLCYNEVCFLLRIVLQWTLLQVRISAGSLCGLHYALCSFAQLLRLSATEPGGHVLVPVLIQDHPAMRHRAVLLDMSPRGRVPTLVSLVWFIDLREGMYGTVRTFTVFLIKTVNFQSHSAYKCLPFEHWQRERLVVFRAPTKQHGDKTCRWV